jgi:hypothetical protein
MQIVGGSNISTMKGGLRNWLALFTRLSVEQQRAARSCVPTPKPSEAGVAAMPIGFAGFCSSGQRPPRWPPGRCAAGMSVESTDCDDLSRSAVRAHARRDRGSLRLPEAHAPPDMPQRPGEDAHRKHRDHDHDRQDHPPNHGAQRPPPFMVPTQPHTPTILRRSRVLAPPRSRKGLQEVAPVGRCFGSAADSLRVYALAPCTQAR